jgi:hypothetical protein
MRLFRERLLARLVERRAISKELVGKLLAWRHSGFSAHVGQAIAPEDTQRLEDTAAYAPRLGDHRLHVATRALRHAAARVRGLRPGSTPPLPVTPHAP